MNDKHVDTLASAIRSVGSAIRYLAIMVMMHACLTSMPH
jgi:hypothetical protein